MSRLSHISNHAGSDRAARTINEMERMKADYLSAEVDSTLTGNVLAMESFDEGSAQLQSLDNVYNNLTEQLASSPLADAYLKGLPPHQRDVALECAALTMMASGDAASWHRSSAFTNANMAKGGVEIDPSQGLLNYAGEEEAKIALEGFDPASANQWMSHSATANALASIQGGFEEAWYPILVAPAGVGGVDVSITIPKVLQPVYRSGGSGAPVQFEKVSVIEAYVDDTILDNPVTSIYPVAQDATTPALMVPAAQVPNTTKELAGVTIDTRPLLFDERIDVIDISSHSGLIANGVMNETDALDSVINIGDIYVNVSTDDNGTTRAFTAKLDISNQRGSLLQRVAEGRGREYIANSTFTVTVTNETPMIVPTGGTEQQILDQINAALGQASGSDFRIVIEVELAAHADTEYGTMKVALGDIRVKEYRDAAGEIVGSLIANNTITPSGVGYFPKARRTNSNLRSRGTIVDSTETNYYRFPARLHAPIMSQNPVGGVVNTSVEGLAHVQRIYNNNNAHKALFSAEMQLAAGGNYGATSPMIGSQLVKPTYLREEVDVTSLVQTMNSKENLDNLRATFTSAVIQMASQLLVDSLYLAALEFTTGNNTDVEVLVLTDPTIFQYLMEAGEPRTLGHGRNYRFSQSLNKNVRDRIYVGLRRKTRDGSINPLDNGVFVFTPALTHEVQVSRGTTTTKEIHTIPVNAHFHLLPVLGRIDVVGLDTLYFTEAP